MRSSILLLLSVWLIPIDVTAQASPNAPEINFRLIGKVLSAEDSSRIAFAHVGIPIDGVGVITNEEGQFELKLDLNMLTSDSLVISFLGFTSQKRLLSGVGNTSDSLHIYLEPNAVLLNDILVTEKGYRGDSALYYVRKAVANFKKNYPGYVHQVSGFYREVIYDSEIDVKYDLHFTRLYEALTRVQDYTITSAPSRMKIEVQQSRKSNDYGRYSIFHKGINSIYEKKNALFELLRGNPIRSHFEQLRTDPDREFFTAILFDDNSKLWIHAKTNYNGSDVYQIKYEARGFVGDIFIDKADFGIYKMSKIFSIKMFKFNEDGSREDATREMSSKYRINRKNNSQVNVAYIKINGTYYLNHLENIAISDIRKSKAHGESILGKTKGLFMVTQVSLKDKGFEKVRKKSAVSKEKDLYLQKHVYDSSFWKSYNIMVETPLEKKVIEDLEFEKSLDDQFKQGGN